MKKIKTYTFWGITYLLHLSFALWWIYQLGVIGMLIIVSHWFLFGYRCCLAYVERYLHIKLIGKTRYNLIPFEKTNIYKIFYSITHKKTKKQNMKKAGLFLVAILATLLVSVQTKAQAPAGTHLFVSGSIGMSDNFVREFAEVGVTTLKQRVTLYSESFVNDFDYRKYFLGVKYVRKFDIISNVIQGGAGLGVDTRLNGTRRGGETAISIRPELGLTINAGPVSLLPRVYAQYLERDRDRYGAAIGIGLTF